MDELKVPLSKPCEVSEGISVWEWSGTALDDGAEASKWFSDYLGKPSRLVVSMKVPTINQENAIASAEPMETSSGQTKSCTQLGNSKGRSTLEFGQNMVCQEAQDCLTEEWKGKMVKVEDPLHVLEVVSSCADAAT